MRNDETIVEVLRLNKVVVLTSIIDDLRDFLTRRDR
jgi:hypothetical protein